jgi:hypothetical protein
VERLEVHRGFEEGEQVEIATVDPEVTLKGGERIVVVGASALSDGARVDAGAIETAGNDETHRDAS